MFVDILAQIFEADQSNLFEEDTVYSRALSYSLAYAIFQLPCDWTIPIYEDFVRRAWNALSTIRQYITQSRKEDGEGVSEGWIGGFSYQPERFQALYNSLSGAAFLCVLMRDPSFAEKKQRAILQGAKEVHSEQAAARALCTLLDALGGVAKSLLRDLQGEGVDSALKLDQARVASEGGENAHVDTETGNTYPVEASKSAAVTIHPLLVAQLVDIAGPVDEPHETVIDKQQACILL